MDWIKVSDALPELEAKMRNVSVNVVVHTEKDNELVAFYDHSSEVWYAYEGAELITEKVTEWRSIARK